MYAYIDILNIKRATGTVVPMAKVVSRGTILVGVCFGYAPFFFSPLSRLPHGPYRSGVGSWNRGVDLGADDGQGRPGRVGRQQWPHAMDTTGTGTSTVRSYRSIPTHTLTVVVRDNEHYYRYSW
jgi:hypothetical protein